MLSTCSYAYGGPIISAVFKHQYQDFFVSEELGFELAGEGEHIYVRVRKSGQNTHWVAQQLARFAEIRTADVGYAGLKDRNAVTEQWFSLYCPRVSELPWANFRIEGVEVIETSRHLRKLKRGNHSRNHFEIVLREVEPLSEYEFGDGEFKYLLEQRVTTVLQAVPNYFGEQRFGRDGSNIILAREWFEHGKTIKNRQLRGLVMSAARSHLFNLVLSERVFQQTWVTVIDGDVPLEEDATPTGPLWGRGRSLSSGETQVIENDVLQHYSAWRHELEHLGLKQERRPLVAHPQNGIGEWADDGLHLRFALAPGQYATSVLRELGNLLVTI